ncbi:MAG: XRE family transcriptional regulator [Desulfobacterales bacterium]|nr:XRE family transcriptional regulator [Desulfobacterales bacterium]
MEDKDDLARRIGVRVKEHRRESGLTQKKLAEATGLSPGLLSRIENGLAMPSIPTLQIISNTLKTEIGYFFKDEEENAYIVTHPGNRRVVVSRSGPHGKLAYELELLAEGMNNPFMEPAIVMHVGKEGEVEARTHDGQEFMYVLEGRMKLTLGAKDFILKQGNAAYWNGNVPHKGIGLGRKMAKALHVHLIPGKWTGTFQYDDLPVQRSKMRSKKIKKSNRKNK